VTVSKGLVSRCFFEWRRLADDRWWKKQLLFREREIELLEKLCGGFRNRPFVVLRKRRLRQVLRCWWTQAVRLRRKRLRLARALRAFRSHQLLAAWNTWIEHTDVRHPCLCACNTPNVPCLVTPVHDFCVLVAFYCTMSNMLERSRKIVQTEDIGNAKFVPRVSLDSFWLQEIGVPTCVAFSKFAFSKLLLCCWRSGEALGSG
jgi:hypothetical protein